MRSVVSKRRAAALERSSRRMTGAAVDFLAFRGLGLADYLELPAELFQRLNDPTRRREWERRHQRAKERYAVEVNEAKARDKVEQLSAVA